MGNKVLGEQRNVLRALAQGGQAHRNQVDAVEQVFAEAALRHQFGQVAVGGGDDADVEPAGLAVAEHLVGTVLEHAQEFYLTGQF